jgi:Rrf2 family transcriptional regulator, repressor of oqxAB
MSAKVPASLGWFRLAVHGLVILAETGDVCSSVMLARDLKAHAVFLRRVMAQLVQSRIVVAREGRDGGYRLARPAESITLAEVYMAVKAAEPPAETRVNQGGNAPVEQALDEVAAEAEQCLLQFLNGRTIASVMTRTGILAGSRMMPDEDGASS